MKDVLFACAGGTVNCHPFSMPVAFLFQHTNHTNKHKKAAAAAAAEIEEPKCKPC